MTNLQVLAAQSGRANTSVAQLELFRQHPDFAGWTAAVEQMMRTDHDTYQLVRTLPEAKLYAITAMAGTAQPALVVVAYAVSGGVPFTLALTASGTYGELGTLERDGILDDFAPMAGSIAPVPVDASHVSPPLPTPPAGVAGSPTTEPSTAPMAAGSGASATSEYVVRPATSTAPSKAVTDQAMAVLSARLHALGIGNFTVAAGDVVTVTVPASADQAAIRAVLTTTGQVSFVPLPPATYGSVNGSGTQPIPNPGDALDPALTPVLGSSQIAGAQATTDASGNPGVEFRLTPAGTSAFAAWTSSHAGEFFAVVLDGRVLAAPYVKTPITDGQGTLILSQDGLSIRVPAVVAILSSGPLPDAWRQGQ